MTNLKSLILALTALILLSQITACGQRGALYLPTEEQKQTTTAPTEEDAQTTTSTRAKN